MVTAEQRSLPIESGQQPKSSRQVWSPTRSDAAAKKCVAAAMVVLAGFVLCMLYTYQVSRIITMGYQSDNVQNSVAELQRENGQLELEAAELQTPERVEQIATTKLGMQQPQDFMVASSFTGQVSLQSPQSQTPSTTSSWSARLLAAIPRFVGRAEASPQ